MKLHLATILLNDTSTAVISDGNLLWPVAKLAAHLGFDDFPTDLISIFQNWDKNRLLLENMLLSAVNQFGQNGIPVEDAKFGAPLQFPGKVLCAGANYYDHLAEMGLKDTSKEKQRLFFFFKPPKSTVVGPGKTIVIPRRSNQYDWELELAVVFGKTVKDATLENAMDGIAAASIAIDLSARDRNAAPNTFYKVDWVAGKANDTSCPMGPWLVPVDQIEDLENLKMQLSVNGELKQDANTSGMIFSIAEQIVEASSIMPLEPGDVLLTGTPAGVGKPKGTFLNPGDRISASIEGLGRLDVEVLPKKK